MGCPNQGATDDQEPEGLEFLVCSVRFLQSQAACTASLRAAAAVEDATHTSRAALRLGTAAVVKRSAGLDCVSVSPLGSVVIPGSASVSPPMTARTQAQCLGWLQRCCGFHHAQVERSKNDPHRRHWPKPCSSDCPVFFARW